MSPRLCKGEREATCIEDCVTRTFIYTRVVPGRFQDDYSRFDRYDVVGRPAVEALRRELERGRFEVRTRSGDAEDDTHRVCDKT